MADDRDPHERPAGFFETLRSIGWAFLGIRGRKAHERDVSRLNPVYLVIAALLAAAVFVAILILVATSVT